jgi:hypothetical protein
MPRDILLVFTESNVDNSIAKTPAAGIERERRGQYFAGDE